MPLGQIFLNELEAEATSTRKCLERIPIDKVFDWKPHEKSMQMGYLSVLVADMPNWISYAIEEGEIDFATYPRAKIKTTKDLVDHFDKSIARAKRVLAEVEDEEFSKIFTLKNNGQLLMSDTKENTVSSSLNHWVHHRGQLTVYMRLNDIPVPSIYGPSADEKTF